VRPMQSAAMSFKKFVTHLYDIHTYKCLPQCVTEILCPRLPHPSNGIRTETDAGVGSEVLYQCDQGYTMQGSPTLTCTQQGTEGVWSQQPPVCNSQ
jgi:hypothetical protein